MNIAQKPPQGKAVKPPRKTASKRYADIDIATTAPDTPGGIFMRQFWICVHRSEDLPKRRAKPIRIMSEDFTLYRGETGDVHVIDNACPHRGAPMHLGWIENEDIRCIYHGWKFDSHGQCTEQPAEGAGFARKVRIRSYPCAEYLGMIWSYFGEGDAPHFPPFPHRATPGVIQTWNVEHVPCNYLQSFENTFDEVHVAFTHAPGGSHAKLSADLPEITAQETDWGILRFGKRKSGLVRQSLHYAPNVARVIVPPVSGMEGVGGWPEIYFSFTPVDDENHIWYITSHVEASGKELEAYHQQRKKYETALAGAKPSVAMANEVLAGQHYYADVRHPDLAIVQDIAVQAGQGRVADRAREHLGRSDAGIIAWRKVLMRELALIAAGKPHKKWKTPPADVVPTLGF